MPTPLVLVRWNEGRSLFREDGGEDRGLVKKLTALSSEEGVDGAGKVGNGVVLSNMLSGSLSTASAAASPKSPIFGIQDSSHMQSQIPFAFVIESRDIS